MRKLSPLFLSLALLPASALAQNSIGFDTNAPHAVIMDYDSQEVLFQKDAIRAMPPASMTKIMTAFMVFEALESGQITLDTEFTVSEEAWRRGGAKSGSSTMFLDLNSKVKVEDLLRGVIIQSGNDACIVLAEGLAGSEAAFAALMTARAKALGLDSANFVNATGWPDEGHEISAIDLAKLAEMMIRRFPQHYDLYNERSFTWNNIKQGNRNPLLGRFTGADGLKTGHTEVSGYGLVGSAILDGERRIIVLNGTDSQSDRRETAIELMTAAYKNFKVYNLFKTDQVIGQADVYMGQQAQVGVKIEEDLQVGLAILSRPNLRTELHIKTAIAPISIGDELGEVVVFNGEDEIKRVKAVAANNVPEKSFIGKAIASLVNMVKG